MKLQTVKKQTAQIELVCFSMKD